MSATTTPTPGAPAPDARPATGSPSPARAVSFWEGVKFIAAREISTQVRSRAFQVSYAITLLLVAVGIVAVPLMGSLFKGGDDGPVAVVADTSAVAQEAGLTTVLVESPQAAVDAITAGEVSSAVLPASALAEITTYNGDGTPGTDPGAAPFIVIGATEPSQAVTMALTVSPEGFAIEPPTASPVMRYLLTIAFGLLYFMSALTYCITIAQSVVEEKQSRIVEILLATVSPRTIMAGKVLGNSLLAIAQVASIALVAVVMLGFTGQLPIVLQLLPSIVWFAVLFTVGFVLIAALYAGVAATVSRQEEVSSATTPLMFLIMIPYMLSFMAVNNPELLRVMSYVPFSAPSAMPARVYTGDAMWWEPVLALVILLATAAGAIWVGAKIYENSVLRTGSRVKILDALRRS